VSAGTLLQLYHVCRGPITKITNSQSQSHFATDSQSVCLGADIYFSLKVTVLSIWGALSDERSGLSFVSHSR
jgi:hypothetical protein